MTGLMSNEQARYTSDFRDADLAVPVNAEGDIGAQTRYARSVLVYQAALVAAGLEPPDWKPSLRAPKRGSLLGQKLIDALSPENNRNSDNQADYLQAAKILTGAKANNFIISWENLVTVCTALSKFIKDSNGGYKDFENDQQEKSESGEPWAEPRLKSLLGIFQYQHGPRIFQTAREQHDPKRTMDFAEEVVKDLQDGKLVIIDQSGGDPEQIQNASERVMWQLFNTQQGLFKSRMTSGGYSAESKDGHVIVYIEEAHNLLPSRSTPETLKGVWARSAKEGSKYNLGMVLATQAPSFDNA